MPAVMKKTLRPTCPHPGHERSRVWLWGKRGPEGHQRPRWKCFPENGDKPHEFSEVLPRQMTHDGFCDECERVYAPNEGPQAARDYLYTIRDVSRALIRVGQGGTYREASNAARKHARRGRRINKHETRYSDHAQLVSDWVEVYAQVVSPPCATWPESGSVLLDEVPFRTNTGVQGGQRTFSILAAMGWDSKRKAIRIYRLESFPERPNMVPAWEQFMRSLEGQPQRIVCDRGPSLVRAVSNVYPESDVHYCEYHLMERCRIKLHSLGLAVPGTPAYDAIDLAFTSPTHFATLKEAWRTVQNPSQRKKLASYLRNLEKVIMPQLERRSTSKPGQWNPNGTGPLENTLTWLRAHITYRASVLSNKQRLDRALLLMTQHLNGFADEREYSERIREWLMTNDGHPRVKRREITDPLGNPSLRP